MPGKFADSTRFVLLRPSGILAELRGFLKVRSAPATCGSTFMAINPSKIRMRQLLAAEGYLALNMPDHALRELVRHRKQKEILKLKGEIHWEGDLSQMRQGRHF